MNPSTGGFQKQIETTIQRYMELMKAGVSTSTGLVFYDLEPEAKYLYPVLAPLRKTIPRIGSTNPQGGQGLAAHWNIITNPNSQGVPAQAAEGKRGGLLTPATAAKVSTYKLLGLDNVATWQSEWAGVGYEDIRAAVQRMTLDSMILAEEPMLLWANSGTSGVGLNFGTTPTPVGTAATSGGSLADATFYIYCIALTHQGWTFATAQNPIAVVPQYTKTNGDGTTDVINGGSAALSLVSTGVVLSGGGGVGLVTATVAAVPGAAAYAWFVGTTTGASNAHISQITTINKALIKTLPTTGQLASATGLNTDYSANPLAFDGLIPQAIAGNGVFSSLDGAALTGDGAGGINEIDAVLKTLWDLYKTSPTALIYGSGVAKSIKKIILSTSSNLGYRVDLKNVIGDVGSLTGNAYFSSYTNIFALGNRKPIDLVIHPNMPDGHIFFDMDVNPYPSANIAYARAVRTLRDYFQVLWPPRSAQYENSIFAAEMLQVYTPYSLALLSGVSNS